MGISTLELILRINQQWMLGSGRAFPVAIFTTYPPHIWAHSLAVYRFGHLATVIADIAMFAVLMRELRLNNRTLLISCAALAMLLEFSPRWDGVSSFAPLNQLVLLWILAMWWACMRMNQFATIYEDRFTKVAA